MENRDQNSSSHTPEVLWKTLNTPQIIPIHQYPPQISSKTNRSNLPKSLLTQCFSKFPVWNGILSRSVCIVGSGKMWLYCNTLPDAKIFSGCGAVITAILRVDGSVTRALSGPDLFSGTFTCPEERLGASISASRSGGRCSCRTSGDAVCSPPIDPTGLHT